jgi:hypothetical protein
LGSPRSCKITAWRYLNAKLWACATYFLRVFPRSQATKVVLVLSMNELLETDLAESVLDVAHDRAGFYAAEHDLDAAVVALLVRAIELATGRTVNMETMYDIRIE